MTYHMIDFEQHLDNVERPRISLRLDVMIAKIGAGLKRVNAALASALLKGEPSWMMYK